MKKVIAINFIVILSFIIAGVYYIAAFEDISSGLLRMHVISNSNSPEDTAVKLGVRDSILKSIDITKKSDKSEVISRLSEFEETANEYLKASGKEYRARVELERAEIPRKEYNGIVLPKGDYSAIRVILGSGAGENWWCVAYPPLCFTEAVAGKMSREGNEALKKNLDSPSYRMITSDIKFEIKLLEAAQKLIKGILN